MAIMKIRYPPNVLGSPLLKRAIKSIYNKAINDNYVIETSQIPSDKPKKFAERI